MERLSVAFLLLCVFCGIRISASGHLIDSQPNLHLQRALESLVKELQSEIKTSRSTEANLFDEIRTLKQNQKLAEAKFADEINELKQRRLQDSVVISQLKAELKYTNEDLGTLQIRMDMCDATNNEKRNSKFDSIKLFEPEKVHSEPAETETIIENISELNNVEVLQKNGEKLNPKKGKESRTQYGASQILNPNLRSDTSKIPGSDKRHRTGS